jgi:hypothetical protein
MPELHKGMARSGRSREAFEITGGGFLATGPDDETVHRRREWVRYRVGFYGSTPAYFPVLEAHGLHDLGPKLNRMTREVAWDKLAEPIDDDVLDLFVASGRHDQIKAVIERRFAAAVDTIFANANPAEPADLPPDLVQELAGIQTPFRGFDPGSAP